MQVLTVSFQYVGQGELEFLNKYTNGRQLDTRFIFVDDNTPNGFKFAMEVRIVTTDPDRDINWLMLGLGHTIIGYDIHNVDYPGEPWY